MISYPSSSPSMLDSSAVAIVGIGGAGANIMKHIVLDGMDGSFKLALNTDIRALNQSTAPRMIQLGKHLTKGLGAGGDPLIGQQAAIEAETEIREALKDCRIVFICAGLGGGTGSGSTPEVAKIAREMGAFVVIFVSMPFKFEGKRRLEQAEASLNQLAVLSNALVTFDNNRMGELTVRDEGIHEAFLAADMMVCESIKAVIRLVVRPGIINVGLDELVTALRTTRSRCLFGSGMAAGENRAERALKNALSSPLLEKGNLLKNSESVLVHLAGGKTLSLYEIEQLMSSLRTHVPDSAQVLFGAAIDESMGDSISVTIISALPEGVLEQYVPEELNLPELAPAIAEPIQDEPDFSLVEEVSELANKEPETEPEAAIPSPVLADKVIEQKPMTQTVDPSIFIPIGAQNILEQMVTDATRSASRESAKPSATSVETSEAENAPQPAIKEAGPMVAEVEVAAPETHPFVKDEETSPAKDLDLAENEPFIASDDLLFPPQLSAEKEEDIDRANLDLPAFLRKRSKIN